MFGNIYFDCLGLVFFAKFLFSERNDKLPEIADSFANCFRKDALKDTVPLRSFAFNIMNLLDPFSPYASCLHEHVRQILTIEKVLVRLCNNMSLQDNNLTVLHYLQTTKIICKIMSF